MPFFTVTLRPSPQRTNPKSATVGECKKRLVFLCDIGFPFHSSPRVTTLSRLTLHFILRPWRAPGYRKVELQQRSDACRETRLDPARDHELPPRGGMGHSGRT